MCTLSARTTGRGRRQRAVLVVVVVTGELKQNLRFLVLDAFLLVVGGPVARVMTERRKAATTRHR